MSAHAFLAPSAAHRWVRCPFSAGLEAAYPETEASPASLEGTAAHWAVQGVLQGMEVVVGQQAPNGVAVTREMLEAAGLVRKDIIATLGDNWRQLLVIERLVRIPRVHADNWGTPDYVAGSRLPDGRLCLHVWDFKYGHGIVEAFENWQLLDYAAGLLDEAGVDGLQDQATLLDLVILQPRAYHRDGPVRRWRLAASDLRGYVNRLANAAGLALSEKPPAVPTPEGCRHCAGRHACEALQRAAGAAADEGGQYGALDLSPHALGLEQRMLVRARELLDARISGNAAQIEAAIKAGQLVPFWRMEPTPGRLGWTRPAAEVFVLGDMLGLKLQKDPEPITPTQAKAVAQAAKIDGSLFDAYSARPAGSAKLVPDDGTKARLTFSSSNT